MPKFQVPTNKFQKGRTVPNPRNRPYDFLERAKLFAIEVRSFMKRLPQHAANFEDIRQLTRSSGAVGANYIEANDSLGKKDFRKRLRIARKEAKETAYWLDLVDVGDDPTTEHMRTVLREESVQLLKILSAMLLKSDAND